MVATLNYFMLYPREFEQMQRVIRTWVKPTERQWEILSGIFHIKKIEAGEYLLQPGDNQHELLFVCEGLLRFYYPAKNGTESNKAFVGENTFAGALAASALKLPVIYGVEALESSTLLMTNIADFTELYDEHPVFDRLGRKLTELLLMRKELRTRSFMQQSAKERYLDFCDKHSELLARVPQYHIASYLGISEVSLSRLKKDILAENVSAVRV